MHFVGMFPYLIFSFLLFLLFVLGLTISPARFKRSVCLSAILSAPTSLASFAFVPGYWDPKRIVPYEIGPEDVIFSFSTGGIIWLFIILIISLKYDVRHNDRIFFVKYAGLLFFGLLLYFLMWLTRIDIMLATIITVFIIGIWILTQKPDYLILSVVGAIVFPLFYFCILKGFFVMFPEFREQWSLEKLLGIQALGIPVEELMWAFATGAVWPLIIAYLLNVKLDNKYYKSMVKLKLNPMR